MIDNLIKNLILSLDTWSFDTKEKILLFKELWHLLKWWVGIAESLDIIGQNTDNFAIKELVASMREQINQWKNLSHAMARFPKYFDDADIATIQSGESSGNVESILSMLWAEYNYLMVLKNKFIGALTYPAILMTVSLGAIIALFVFVLPAIFDIATQLDSSKIPRLTLKLKAFSDFLIAHGMWLLWLIWFGLFALFIFASTQSGQKILYSTLYNLPIVGKMVQSYYLVRFARYSKILLGSGMNYRDVFKMLSNVISIPIFTPLFEKIINWLERGQSIYDSIQYETMLIPSTVSALIKVGEKTASLDATFDTIISIYSEELDSYINNLSKMIEPIMLVIVGSVIVLIALWVFWVIMSIMDSVGI